MKILIGYDGSICADAALHDLNRAGLPHDLDVLVLSVADVVLPPRSGTTDQQDPEWVVAAINKAHTRQLRRWRKHAPWR